MSDLYRNLGVSSKKEDVSSAVDLLAKSCKSALGVFPNAFCKAIENPFPYVKSVSGEPLLYLSHADGTGTKSSLAYLYWKETGDLSVFKDLMQDAVVMNTDDLLCVGVVDHFYFSSTLGRNKHLIPGEVVTALIKGQQQVVEELQSVGVACQSLGGETADVGDVVKTLSVDMTATTFLPKSKFIDTNQIEPNQVIIGFASAGQTSYETSYNSGMGSNGLTLARHLILHSDYVKKYPESYDERNKKLAYQGKYKINDVLTMIDDQVVSFGKALLSPTRTYLPVVKGILDEGVPISALIHLTGGGQAKCVKFGEGIHFVKDNLFDLPPLFETLLDTEISEQELYSVFNAGHRLECYVDEKYSQTIIDIASRFSLEAKKVGYTEKSDKPNNYMTLTHQGKAGNEKKNFNFI